MSPYVPRIRLFSYHYQLALSPLSFPSLSPSLWGLLFSFHFASFIRPPRVSRTKRSAYSITRFLLRFSQPMVCLYRSPYTEITRKATAEVCILHSRVSRVGTQHIRTSILFSYPYSYGIIYTWRSARINNRWIFSAGCYSASSPHKRSWPNLQ